MSRAKQPKVTDGSTAADERETGVSMRHFVCGEPATLTFDELFVTARLSNPSSYTPRRVFCQLEEHEAGEHVAYLTTDEQVLPDGDSQEWWFVWDGGIRGVVPLSGCDATGAPEELGLQHCLLTAEHSGAHSFTIGSRRPASRQDDGAVISAPLAALIEQASVTPREVCRWLTGFVGREVAPAELDELPMAEALLLDQILQNSSA